MDRPHTNAVRETSVWDVSSTAFAETILVGLLLFVALEAGFADVETFGTLYDALTAKGALVAMRAAISVVTRRFAVSPACYPVLARAATLTAAVVGILGSLADDASAPFDASLGGLRVCRRR